MTYSPSRLELALRHPRAVLGITDHRVASIPPGGTTAVGALGHVRAGLELSAQIRDGLMPTPDRIYVALGTGGTVAGLAIGLAMGGTPTEIRAVTTVERIISTKAGLERLMRSVLRLLAGQGVPHAQSTVPVPITIDRSQLGPGYGWTTTASLAAVSRFSHFGPDLEPVYTGKTAAAMLHDLDHGLRGSVLFWNSRRGPLPEPQGGWEQRLPGALRARLGLGGHQRASGHGTYFGNNIEKGPHVGKG